MEHKKPNSDQNIRNHNSDQIMKMEMVIIMSIMTGYHCRFAFPPEAVWGIIETYNNEKINDTTYKSEVIETVTVHPSERGIEMVPIATEPEDVDADYFLYYLIFVFVILGIHLLFSVALGLLCGFIALVIKMIQQRIDKKLEEDLEAGRRPLSDLPGPVLWAPLPAPLHEMTSL